MLNKFSFNFLQSYSRQYTVEEVKQVDEAFLSYMAFIDNVNGSISKDGKELFQTPSDWSDKNGSRKRKLSKSFDSNWYFAFRRHPSHKLDEVNGNGGREGRTYEIHLVIPEKGIDLPIIERVSPGVVRTIDSSVHFISIDSFDALSFFSPSNVELATKSVLQEFVSSLKEGRGLTENWKEILEKLNLNTMEKQITSQTNFDEPNVQSAHAIHSRISSDNSSQLSRKSSGTRKRDTGRESGRSTTSKNHGNSFKYESSFADNDDLNELQDPNENNNRLSTKKLLPTNVIQDGDDDMSESDFDDDNLSNRLESYNRAWTDKEIHYLVQGVIRFGYGKWKKILTCPEYSFKSCRNANSISHKARYMGLQKYKQRHKQKKLTMKLVKQSEKNSKSTKKNNKSKSNNEGLEDLENVNVNHDQDIVRGRETFIQESTFDINTSEMEQLENTNHKKPKQQKSTKDRENLLNVSSYSQARSNKNKQESRKRTITQREESKKPLEPDYMGYISDDTASSVDVSKSAKRKRVEDIPPSRLRVLPPPSELSDGFQSSNDKTAMISSSTNPILWPGNDSNQKTQITKSQDKFENQKQVSSHDNFPSKQTSLWRVRADRSKDTATTKKQDYQQHSNSLKDDSDEDDLDNMDDLL